MKDNDETSSRGLHGQPKSAIQVICLGHSGGPSEENATAFLVRSIASDWAKGSLLAVDAGSHLAPITRILEQSFPGVSLEHGRTGSNYPNGAKTPTIRLPRLRSSLSPDPTGDDDDDSTPLPEPTSVTSGPLSGPFAGLTLPNASARANAASIVRSYVSTYLITHPHLDHVCGFAINTAAFHGGTRPKTLAALPSTVEAIKRHIFNDVIWPNLTDEDGGVGFVTFQRLKEGGDAMVGEGDGRGYIDVCDGLGVKAFKVSHGCSTKGPPSHQHQHRGSIPGLSDGAPGYNIGPAEMTRMNSMTQFSTPGTPRQQSFHASNSMSQQSPHQSGVEGGSVVESTAFFVRDSATAREILMFGDVEPDSVSFAPRNHTIWMEAAPKIASGVLGGIFIECSYDDSQADAFLFGHMVPRHIIAELQTLASMVAEAKSQRAIEKGIRKRKRSGQNGTEMLKSASQEADRKRSRSLASRTLSQNARRTSVPEMTSPTSQSNLATHQEMSEMAEGQEPISPKSATFQRTGSGAEPPLQGLKVVIIHIKDTLKDGPHVSENILAQLQEAELDLASHGQGLGCEFVISRSGESYWL